MPRIEEPFQAIINGDKPRLLDMIQRNPSIVHTRSAHGETPLIVAAYRGQLEMVELLLENGAEMGIHEAATLGQTCRIEEIVKSDPKAVDAISSDGWTALHLAAHFNRKETTQRLIELGALVDAASASTSLAPGNTPLHAASAAGHYEPALVLLEYGANVAARQANGMTPLHVAAAGTNAGLVRLLLEHKADPRAIDDAGMMPVDLALKFERYEIADILRAAPTTA
ncbi:MAG: ankyrin repeat domain-containing protein [Candidatus Hydrogenedentes bacterium]|nr:ankyrin repeat domain-containing protein [Candidatus Hydrogenedentota bacterium]